MCTGIYSLPNNNTNVFFSSNFRAFQMLVAKSKTSLNLVRFIMYTFYDVKNRIHLYFNDTDPFRERVVHAFPFNWIEGNVIL